MDKYYRKNLYEILGIEPTQDVAQIKAAYRKLARKYHPDLHANNPEFVEKFKDITEANEILTDAKKKANYDMFKGYSFTQKSDKQTQNQQEQPQEWESASKAYKKKSEQKFSKVFNEFFDGFFDEKKPKKKPIDGENITTHVKISYKEAINGTNRTINVLHTRCCPKCEGRKMINGAKCPLCGGRGTTSIHKKINVKIPAGIKNGTKIRVAGESNPGINGGKDGNLYLKVEIQESKFFNIDGLNVSCEVPITVCEAVLGAIITIPTPTGEVSMKIPPNTSSGQKFRLANQGLKDTKSNKTGDMIVTVVIKVKADISDKEKKLFEELEKFETEDIRKNLTNE